MELPVLPAWAHHPPPGSIRGVGESTGEGQRYFLWKVISVLRISTHPTPSHEEGPETLPSPGKMRSLSNRSLREPPQVPHGEPAWCISQPRRSCIKLQYQVRLYLILDPWPFSPPPPIPFTTVAKGQMKGARSRDETYYTSLLPRPRQAWSGNGEKICLFCFVLF